MVDNFKWFNQVNIIIYFSNFSKEYIPSFFCYDLGIKDRIALDKG